MISLLGDWAGRLALTVLVLERTGSPAWAAAVTAVSLAGFVGIGQVLATFADRYGRITVMLVADVARAGLFLAMLLDVPVGVLLVLAFLAGSPRLRSRRPGPPPCPTSCPEDRYRDALALSGISVQFSLVLGLRARWPAPHGRGSRGGPRHQRVQLPRVRRAAPRAPQQRGRPPGIGSLDGRALARRRCRHALRRPDGAPCPRLRLGDRGTGHGGRGPRGALRRTTSVCPDGLLGLLAASIPVGTLVATAVIAGGRRDHHSLLRTAAWCGAITSALAAPLFWFEASGALAFVAFAISGGMFAVSIPTNAVIGLRLTRDTRASAMGIAVGVLMGSQALGAALGGIAASVVGSPHAIGGALAAAAVFSLWAVATTPVDAKHLAVGRRPAPARGPIVAVEPLPAPDTVVDLVAMETVKHPPSSRRPGSGEPSGRGVRIPGHDDSRPIAPRRPSSRCCARCSSSRLPRAGRMTRRTPAPRAPRRPAPPSTTPTAPPAATRAEPASPARSWPRTSR